MIDTELPLPLVGDRPVSGSSSIGPDVDDERPASLLVHIVHTPRLPS